MKRMLCGVCIGIALSTTANAWAATLIENGQARAVIVIPAGQKSTAAGELQHYLLKAAGAKVPIHQLTDGYTDAQLAELETCATRAIAAIGARDPAALERARLVATGLEYTRKTRDLLAAAAAVRQRRGDRAQFQKVHTETLAYYQSLALSWAVAVEHNYRHLRRGLGLKPASPEKTE